MDKGISGYIGERYVMIELLRNGFDAYFPPSSTQNGWDILVNKNSRNIKIQVKLIDWNSDTNKSTRGKFDTIKFDYLVIVLMNFGKSTRYRALIIPKGRLQPKHVGRCRGCIDGSNNILYSIPNAKGKSSITLTDYKDRNIRAIINKEYLNRWDLIK